LKKVSLAAKEDKLQDTLRFASRFFFRLFFMFLNVNTGCLEISLDKKERRWYKKDKVTVFFETS